MARVKVGRIQLQEGAHSTSGRGASNRLRLSSSPATGVLDSPISRSTSATRSHATAGTSVAPIAPRAASAHVSPHVNAAPFVPQMENVSEDDDMENVPEDDDMENVHEDDDIENVHEDDNHVNDQLRNTRGVTMGVNAPKVGQSKVLVTVFKNTLTHATATSKIGPIIRRHFNKLRVTWCEWSDPEINSMWAEYLADSLGCHPTQIERFTDTHIRRNKNNDNNGNVWVTKDAEKLEEVYANELRHVNGLGLETPVNAVLNPGCAAVSDPGCKTWEGVVSGVRKGRLYGRPGEK